MKKIPSLLALCATMIFASCSKGGPVTKPVPEGIIITTCEALLTAPQTGGTSADVPMLIMLGDDITIPVGGDNNNPPMNGSGYFKMNGGDHTLTQKGEGNNFHFLGNSSPDAGAVYTELTNISLVRQSIDSAVDVYSDRITLGRDVTLNGQHETMVMIVGEKVVLELGDGRKLPCTATSDSCCVSVWYGATLALNGGKTAAGVYIDLHSTYNPTVSHPLTSVPRALMSDVHLFFTTTGVTSIIQDAGGYQLTQADCGRLKVGPELMVSFYGEPHQKYDDNFEPYFDPGAEHQIKPRLENFTPPTSGNVNMTSMAADEAQLVILTALAVGFTGIKLTGEFSKARIGGNWGTFVNNKKIMKCDLTGVTDWDRKPILPDVTSAGCIVLQEVTSPDDMKVIGGSAFSDCIALTTMNLSQVTRINLNAFWRCTSSETPVLDNATAIGQEAFYGCMGPEALKMPKCIEFDTHVVTGCRSPTRIEATVAGNLADVSDGRSNTERIVVFHNRDSHYGDSAFGPAKYDLVLNADKKRGDNVTPKVSSDNEWLMMPNGQLIRWDSITFGQQ